MSGFLKMAQEFLSGTGSAEPAASATSAASAASITPDADSPGYTATPDRFGNLVIHFNVKPSPDTIVEIHNEYTSKYSAIIFEPCVLETPPAYTPTVHDMTSVYGDYNHRVIEGCRSLPETERAHKITQSIAKHMRDGVWLIRNGSNCPDLHGGEIHASGVIILVKYNDTTYFIGVKDRTKGVISAPGGGADECEVGNPAATAIREVREETEDPGCVDPLPLSTTTSELRKICTIKMKSAYFGIPDIPDTYTVFLDIHNYENHAAAGSPPGTGFFPNLFAGSPDESGIYSLELKNNKEIEFVHAFPIEDVDVTVECLESEAKLTEFCNALKAGPLSKPIGAYKDRERKPIISSLFATNAYLAHHVSRRFARIGATQPDCTLNDVDGLKTFQPRLTLESLAYTFW